MSNFNSLFSDFINNASGFTGINSTNAIPAGYAANVVEQINMSYSGWSQDQKKFEILFEMKIGKNRYITTFEDDMVILRIFEDNKQEKELKETNEILGYMENILSKEQYLEFEKVVLESV
ncbi:MAG: hypothetical protein K9H48_07650 [Melioribacteraceae bacterium]|nr:hypothetical protein [Melioribacteraceae bacterium]